MSSGAVAGGEAKLGESDCHRSSGPWQLEGHQKRTRSRRGHDVDELQFKVRIEQRDYSVSGHRVNFIISGIVRQRSQNESVTRVGFGSRVVAV
jgi:hypothetical protein